MAVEHHRSNRFPSTTLINPHAEILDNDSNLGLIPCLLTLTHHYSSTLMIHVIGGEMGLRNIIIPSNLRNIGQNTNMDEGVQRTRATRDNLKAKQDETGMCNDIAYMDEK